VISTVKKLFCVFLFINRELEHDIHPIYSFNGDPCPLGIAFDSQYASTSRYKNDEGVQMLFGVNLADGRIKGYEEDFFGSPKTYFVQCVRGNTQYGTPEFVNNGDKTITDKQSNLMWTQDDSGSAFIIGIDYKNALDWLQSSEEDDSPLKDGSNKNGAMDWVEALAYVQKMNNQKYLGYSDWRLPSVKELHTLTDYRYSPAKTNSPAEAKWKVKWQICFLRCLWSLYGV